MTDQNIVFKNSKTGKVEQITANDIELVNFQKFIGSFGLRIFMKNGTLHRFGGFKEEVWVICIWNIIQFLVNRKNNTCHKYANVCLYKIFHGKFITMYWK